jgi:single-strand DNA-binding protein
MIAATVSGRIGREAEIRDTKAGQVVSFAMASDGYERGEKKTTWVSVSFFGARAVKVSGFLVKGAYVVVTGRLSLREYESQGVQKTALEMNANEVELGPRQGSYGTSGEGNASKHRVDPEPSDDFNGQF